MRKIILAIFSLLVSSVDLRAPQNINDLQAKALAAGVVLPNAPAQQRNVDATAAHIQRQNADRRSGAKAVSSRYLARMTDTGAASSESSTVDSALPAWGRNETNGQGPIDPYGAGLSADPVDAQDLGWDKTPPSSSSFREWGEA
jgi:hypothetical protein